MSIALLKDLPIPRVAKLAAAAKDYPCANCHKNDGTIVAAHNNELAFGRGAYFKTKGFLVAYLCHLCHDLVDGRRGGLSIEEKRALWHRAYTVTVSWWFRDGLVIIK